MLNDLRYAIRMLLKNPGFTAVAVLTLALGIGANTAIFSVINGVLLHPLAYRDADRLAYILESNPSIGESRFSVAPGTFLDWRAQTQTLEGLSAYMGYEFNVSGDDRPEHLEGQVVSADFFSTLRMQPELGRVFTPDDVVQKQSRVALISHQLWQRRFAGDPNTIGQTIRLNSENYTIVGVIPSGPQYLLTYKDIWVPMVLSDADKNNRGGHWLGVVGRLKSGVTVDGAGAEMQTIAQGLETQYPDSKKGWTVLVNPLLDNFVGDVRTPAMLLMGAVVAVLLIACANVASLMLARGAARRREFAIRAALGASRWRILQQLLTEAVAMAVAGGLLGLLLAIGGTRILLTLGPDLPRVEMVQIDQRVLVFTLLISIVSGMVFGLAPALQSIGYRLNKSFKEGTLTASTGRGHSRLRSLMVVTEIALSMMLTIGAALMIESFAHIQQVNTGINPTNRLAARLDLPYPKYPTPKRRSAFLHDVLERLKLAPGVQNVAVASYPPINGGVSRWGFSFEGKAAPVPDALVADTTIISTNYFATIGAALQTGRDFSDQDGAESPAVMIVNEAFVRQFLPDQQPLGQRLNVSDGVSNPVEIVGVVRDIKHRALTEPAPTMMYFPITQRAVSRYWLIVHARQDPASLAPAARDAVLAVDKDQPLDSIRTLNDLVGSTVDGQRLFTWVIATFAGLALTLASIGIYGLMAYSVARRRQEIGIRMALGAQRGDVLKLVALRGVVLIAAGIAIGLAGAFVSSRLLEDLLFEVKSSDPATYIGVAFILALVATVACLGPARRATSVDPMAALRAE